MAKQPRKPSADRHTADRIKVPLTPRMKALLERWADVNEGNVTDGIRTALLFYFRAIGWLPSLEETPPDASPPQRRVGG